MSLKSLANHLYEVGTLRFIPRGHRQPLGTNDDSDNIASHSFRVCLIGLHLAYLEQVDEVKVLKMCLLHDLAEARSGDQNWVHKRYVKVFEDEIVADQLNSLPNKSGLLSVINEYTDRQSPESIVAKDADLLDQVLLLKEYERSGNVEATQWLQGKNDNGKNMQLLRLKTESAKKLGDQILETDPGDWWDNVWTDKNR